MPQGDPPCGIEPAPPSYRDHPEPVAHGKDEMVVDVLAAALHPRVRSQADGSHYTSTDELPLVPGIDAVVRDPKGRIRYTILDDTALGTMADRTIIETDRSAPLAWIQIGSVAGSTAAIPSAALRSARLQIVGSGIGSVPRREFVKELPKMAAAVADGGFDVRARAVPLAEVEQTWTATAGTSDRIVFVP